MGRAVLSAPLVAWFSRLNPSSARAIRKLDRNALDAGLEAMDILTSTRRHPKDEALAAHKLPRSVEPAEPTGVLAKLKARLAMKYEDTSLGGVA